MAILATNFATKQELVKLKFELIKWMLAIGIGEVFAIAGLLKYIH